MRRSVPALLPINPATTVHLRILDVQPTAAKDLGKIGADSVRLCEEREVQRLRTLRLRSS